MKNPENQTTKYANLTREDVVRALGETDPYKTNAGALLEIIGHGSTGTVHKHLNAIRAERAKPSPTPLDATLPPAPEQLIASVWAASWAEARAQTLAKMDLMTSERDSARAQVATLTSDNYALLNECERLEADQARTQGEQEASAAMVKQAVELHATALVRVQAELELARSELAERAAAMAHAAELARRDAELKDAAHDRALQRLVDQVAELKSVLHTATSKLSLTE